MEIWKHPREFNARVDNAAKEEPRRLSKIMNGDDIVVVISHGVSSECDREVRLVEYGEVNPSRRNIVKNLTSVS